MTTTSKATAAKRGRNPHFPYVPVIIHETSQGEGRFPLTRQEQILGAAYVTREEAVAFAQKTIDFRAEREAAGAERQAELRHRYGLLGT